MKNSICKHTLILAWLSGLALVCPAARADDAVRTQTLQLQEGWNAVFLEVYPLASDAETLFGGTPVDVAASFTAGSQAQFTSDPEAALLQRAGWGIWREPGRPDAFLNTLTELQGQQAYLVHAVEAFTWSVPGRVVPAEMEWKPGAFNFVGCGVDAAAPPTFGQYFGPSRAHHHNRIYRLVEGSWRRVVDPAQEAMRSGEAFWIYCDGASRYQGPLKVTASARQGVVLGGGGGDVVLLNATAFPLTPMIHHVPTGSQPVPLSLVIQVVGQESAPVQSVAHAQPDGAWSQALPPLEAGYWLKVPLEARRQAMTRPAQTSLLKITSDWGTETWLPVVGLRPDLQDN